MTATAMAVLGSTAVTAAEGELIKTAAAAAAAATAMAMAVAPVVGAGVAEEAVIAAGESAAAVGTASAAEHLRLATKATASDPVMLP